MNTNTQKEYNRIITKFQNSGLTTSQFLAQISNPNSKRKAENALKSQQLIPSSRRIPVKKSTKKSKYHVTTSRSQLQSIKTTNANIRTFSKNITFEFKPTPISTRSFKQKYNYMLKKILSSIKNFKFTRKTIANAKSLTIFKERTSNYELGHNSGNQICKSLSDLKQIATLLLDLIKSTSSSSNLKISFIDLTITLYKF